MATKLDLKAWIDLGVPYKLAKSLHCKGFSSPTEIQKKCLSDMMKLKNDSFVCSETGSGKTLVYSLPIIARCLSIAREIAEDADKSSKMKLRCLVITPTRELAVQVKKTINNISKELDIHAVDIIGGISEIKQERMLNKRPQIIVGTPGRVFSYMNELPHDYLCDFSGFRLLVVDEVDKMVEEGHFRQLKEIIDFIRKKINGKYTTYVCSATLVTKKMASKYKTKKKQSVFDKISNFLKIDQNFKIYDCSSVNFTPCSLSEYKIFLTEKEAFYCIFEILKKSKKCIIFVNTIKSCNQLNIFLKNLKISTIKLNSKLEQRQRLKLFDKFNANNSVLIATDIAARGLDVPDIDTIIHFDVPNNPDLYVHRSGRTARQAKIGQSILFVKPEHMERYRKILTVLNRTSDLPEYSIDRQELAKSRTIIELSVKLTEQIETLNKLESTDRWFKEKSKAAETILDPSFLKYKLPDPSVIAKLKKTIKVLQSQLNSFISNKCK